MPNYSHAQILEAVFSRTRVPAGVMTGAKLLSSVEPIIRYQRERFRGGEGQPGTPRHDLGLQTKEDAVHRLVDIWAAGEAACSLGFAAARHFDSYAELEKQKHEHLRGGRHAPGRRPASDPAGSAPSSRWNTCGCASRRTTNGTTRGWPNWPRAG